MRERGSVLRVGHGTCVPDNAGRTTCAPTAGGNSHRIPQRCQWEAMVRTGRLGYTGSGWAVLRLLRHPDEPLRATTESIQWAPATVLPFLGFA